MSTSKQTTLLTPNRSTEKGRLSEGQNLPKNTPSGIKDYTVQPRPSASPQRRTSIEPVEVNNEDRRLYEDLIRPNRSDASKSANKGSTLKGVTPYQEKISVHSKVLGSGKPKTPSTDPRDFGAERTPAGEKSGKFSGEKGRNQSGQASRNKLTFSEDRHQRDASYDDSNGKKPSSRKKSGNKVQEGLLRDLDREDVNIKMEIHGRAELPAQEESKHAGDNQGDRNEEGGTERKEYSLFEDIRIIESVENHIRYGGGKGITSLSLWEKITDPKTGRRLLDGTRTAESLKDHYRRTLQLLTKDDLDNIKKFVETHTEDQLQHYFIQYKKDGKNKKYNGIASSSHYNSNNLRRKTPYNASTKELAAQRESIEPSKTKERRSKASEPIGKIESGFYEGRRRPSYEEDDISNITPAQSQLPVRRFPQHHIEPERKIPSTSLANLLNQFAYPGAGSGGRKEKSTAIQVETTPFNYGRSGQIQVEHAPLHQPQKRKSYETERLITREPVDIKRVKTIPEYEHKSLIVTDAFKQKGESPAPWSYDENLSIFVDKERKVRFAIKEQPQIDSVKEREIKRLVQLGKEYDMAFENMMELFERVSNDCDDLENYLKSQNEALLWTSDEDRDLLENNRVALRYLRNIKGDERINRRRNFLAERRY